MDDETQEILNAVESRVVEEVRDEDPLRDMEIVVIAIEETRKHYEEVRNESQEGEE